MSSTFPYGSSTQGFYQQATTDDLLLISNPRYRDEIEADLKDNGLEGITLINL